MFTGMFSPGGGTYLYSATLSAVIRSSIAQAGGGARSTAALYHPWILCQASWIRGGSTPISASTSAPASSARRLRSSAKLSLIARPIRILSACPFAGSRRVETLSSTSLHVSSEIHSFRLPSRTFAFGTALCRAAKASSSLVGVVGGLRGHFFRPPRYLLCYVREALGRQLSTM